MKGEKINCRFCESEFTKSLLTQVYCSNDCLVKHGAQKQKDKVSSQRFNIFSRDGFKCFYCNIPSYENNSRLVIDHLIPQKEWRLRSDEIDNLVTCCTECNGQKGGRLFGEELLKTLQNEVARRNTEYGLTIAK